MRSVNRHVPLYYLPKCIAADKSTILTELTISMASIVILGDAMVDVKSSLVDATPQTATDALHIPQSIRSEVGGTGFNAAILSKIAGFTSVELVVQLGCSGHDQQELDASGRLVLAELSKNEIDVLLEPTPETSTGTTIMVEFRGDDRLLIADSGANSRPYQTETIASLQSPHKSPNVLFISGYTLLHQEKRQQIKALAKHLQAAGTLVALDLVPHNLGRNPEVAEFLRQCDLLCSTAQTLHRATYGTHKDEFNETELLQLAEHHTKGKELVIVHYKNEIEVVATQEEKSEIQKCSYRSTNQKTAYFDGRFINAIVGFFER